MKVIGITGGIGAGKSTVLKILKEQYNAFVIETDILAHKLMEPDEKVYYQIINKFGKDILEEDGTINRTSLGAIVFSDSEALQNLNAIVHPAVKQYIIEDIEKKRLEKETEYYIIEAALLLEDGYKTICDEIWYIYVEKELRIHRLIEGRGCNREKWEQVIKSQSDEAFYRENCDAIIDNGLSVEKTAIQIKDLLS